MKTKPMIFNTEMVKALLDGSKTVTRRPIKSKVTADDCQFSRSPCKIGDLIWVREPMVINCYLDMFYVADQMFVDNEPEDYIYRHIDYVGGIPSIHMPRWASRLTLRVTDVRIERVQDISEEQSIKEGLGSPILRNCKRPMFMQLWDSIYGNWNENPYVWVIEFEVIHKNVDEVA